MADCGTCSCKDCPDFEGECDPCTSCSATKAPPLDLDHEE